MVWLVESAEEYFHSSISFPWEVFLLQKKPRLLFFLLFHENRKYFENSEQSIFLDLFYNHVIVLLSFLPFAEKTNRIPLTKKVFLLGINCKTNNDECIKPKTDGTL